MITAFAPGRFEGKVNLLLAEGETPTATVATKLHANLRTSKGTPAHTIVRQPKHAAILPMTDRIHIWKASSGLIFAAQDA
jgi:hypothetical protein